MGVCPVRKGLGRFEIPNYLTDLNAMHYAEKTLTDDEYEQYFETLPKVLGLDPFFKVESERAMLSSSARQRAEAFLRVKGLWKEQSQS